MFTANGGIWKGLINKRKTRPQQPGVQKTRAIQLKKRNKVRPVSNVELTSLSVTDPALPHPTEPAGGRSRAAGWGRRRGERHTSLKCRKQTDVFVGRQRFIYSPTRPLEVTWKHFFATPRANYELPLYYFVSCERNDSFCRQLIHCLRRVT